MNSGNLGVAAVLTELADAPMAPKRRQRKKAHEAQMCFEFDAIEQDESVDEDANSTAVIAAGETEIADVSRSGFGTVDISVSRFRPSAATAALPEQQSARCRPPSIVLREKRREGSLPWILGDIGPKHRAGPRDTPG